ncbi:MAG TPA: glycosyltransferase [Rhodocyclaceae bacterium]
MPFSVLHTEWSDGWGGQERRIVAEMLGMMRRGHRLLLVTRPDCRIGAEARTLGIPVELLPFRGKFDPTTIRGIARLARRDEYAIVNTHSGVDSWAGGLAAKLAGVKLVRTRHLNLPLKRRWLNFVHYLPDALVTCGEEVRRNLVDNCGFPAGQVVSIPTGIDFGAFRPRHERAATRQALGFADGEFIVLMVGVIRAVKRHEVALRALAALQERLPNARLVLAGDGPMRGDMEALAVQLGLGAKVSFLGHREDVPDLMNAADCLLLTSRSEGVPQAVTQALGLGLPVVATRVGGVPELIDDGRTGLLVPAENADAVAAALARLAADPALARQLGAQGRDHVLAHFSAEAMLDATEALYARLLESRS